MIIQLNWVNRNLSDEGTYVYRSVTPFDGTNLPTPIGVTPPGANQYIDDTAVNGTLYYYRLGTFKGTDIALSKLHTVYTIPNTGPGPQTFSEGDFTYGYFGSLTAAQFTTGTALASAVGLIEGQPQNDSAVWYKFAHKGKILFIPQNTLRLSVSWNQLYNRGLVYGLDGDGPANSGVPRNQQVIVTIGGYNFKVRLLKGDIGDTSTKSGSNIGPGGSEWEDLIYPLWYGQATYQRMGNVATLTDLQLFTSNNTNVGMYNLLQETNGSNCLATGYGAAYKFTQMPKNSNDPNNGWRPCLELIV